MYSVQVYGIPYTRGGTLLPFQMFAFYVCDRHTRNKPCPGYCACTQPTHTHTLSPHFVCFSHAVCIHLQYALSSELVTIMGRVADGLNGLLAGEGVAVAAATIFREGGLSEGGCSF
jgi:hypothetical protein